MTRLAIVAAFFVGLAANAAVAAKSGDITLWFDVDRTVYLQNTTAADISFDGYQIVSKSGGLDPAGWDSISDRFPARLTELMDHLGAGAVTFGELNPNAGQVAEANLTGVGVLKAGAKFSIGKPFSSVVAMDARFFFKVAGITTPFESCIGLACIPEPSTWLLAALGALGLAGVHRRQRGRFVRPW